MQTPCALQRAADPGRPAPLPFSAGRLRAHQLCLGGGHSGSVLPPMLHSVFLFGELWALPGDLCIVRALFFFLSFYLLLIHLINTGHSISFEYTCIWQLCFYYLKELPYCFPLWLDQFTFPPKVYKGSLFSTFLPTFTFSLFDNSHSNRCEVLAHCDFDSHVPDDYWC